MKKRTVWYTLLVMLMLIICPINASADWEKSGGKTYYVSDGKKATGFTTIGKYTYYFGSNGVMRTGWQNIKISDTVYRFYFNKKNGRMATSLAKISKKHYLFAKDGRMLTGMQKVGSKIFYGKKNGVLAQNEWVENTYYFKADCTMAVNTTVDGRKIGADGRAGSAERSGLTKQGSITYYYVNNVKQTGFQKIGGKLYYFASNGAMKSGGWFSVGNYKYYAAKNGQISTSTWVGKKYVLSNGAMATGWQTIKHKRYYFSKKGDKANGWTKVDGKTYYFSDGVMQTNKWIKNGGKKTYYVTSSGSRASGVTAIGKYSYYFDPKTGKVAYGMITSGKKTYWAKANGRLYKNVIFKVGSFRYYANANARIAKGLTRVASKLYYFDKKTMHMITNKKVKAGSAYYYFTANGTAVTGSWQQIGGKYYYFGNDGKMLVNTTVGGYKVGADGARTSESAGYTGWKTVGSNKYYYEKGSAVTGWKTISGAKYYFKSDGAMATGVQSIGGKKYYFYPSGIMAVSTAMAIGSTEYTIGANGVITKETTISVSGNTLGAQIAKYGLKFIGNKYVYGGTSLTNGADCSGFVMSLFANYGIKLLRVADDQRKGPTAAQIKAGYKQAVTVSSSSIQPGDLVFYGSANYASHVGVYIGNGKIVHASNSQPYPAGGIKISNWNYSTPIKIVRYWS